MPHNSASRAVASPSPPCPHEWRNRHVIVYPLAAGAAAGRTVMVKDTIDVAGAPTVAGSSALQDAPAAAAHAEVVENLLAAGCRLIGKTNLHELAYGTTGINHYTGTPDNPRYPGCIPGGSSSGSAVAVAAGLCDFALGTDTGGSIRTPAACCGVFGLKTTFGRISRKGVMPAISSLDCVGPFARDLATLAAAMRAIDPTFGALPDVEQFTLGVVPIAEGTVTPAIRDALHLLLEESALPRVTTPLPGLAAAYEAGMKIIGRETWNACGHLLATGKVGADVAARLAAAAKITDNELAAAETVRAAFTAEVDAALEHAPILALPNLPFAPPRLEDAADTRALLGMTAFVRPFNLSGHPALSLPFSGGSPLSLQFVARKDNEAFLIAAAEAFLKRLRRSPRAPQPPTPLA